MAPADSIQVEVLYCPAPNITDRVVLGLPVGATVADALVASALAQRHVVLAELRVGVWNKPCERNTVLRDGDRVELYRSLLVDPKEARRQRYQQHKASLAARKPKPGPGQTLKPGQA
jgi:uncharacterized protein